jgi:hypothetical protein
MQIELNGLSYIEHNSFYVGALGQYLTLVFTVDISTSHRKVYAGFTARTPVEADIIHIMNYGFKPYELSEWLAANLNDR